MADDFASRVATFKKLDLKREQFGLSYVEQERWVDLKQAIEQATSDHCPPSSQRASLRVPTSYEATFEDRSGFVKAYLRNISEGGVYIESGHTFKMGDRFTLKLSLLQPPVTIEQAVQVVWVNAHPSPQSGLQPGVGVAFLDLPADKKMQIKAIVHNRLDELVAEG